MSGWFKKQEPYLGEKPDKHAKNGGLSVSSDDRIGTGRKKKAERKPGLLSRLFAGSGKKKLKNSRSEPELAAGRGKKASRKSERRPRRRRSIAGGLIYWTAVAGIWGLVAATGIVVYHASKLPPIDRLAVPKRPPNIAILAQDGTLLANRGDTGGPAIQLRELPAYLPKAFVAIEDRRFYSHLGIDPVGIARAVWRNVTRDGRGMEGGSTLTQQLAKNLFLTQERTISRKIQEAILSVWLEQNYSKDQILQLYLNRVYFGSGAYGVEAAAQRYFGKSARDVTLAEAAVLAGLMKAPVRFAPNRNPEAATARASLVVTAMAHEGHITEQMAKVALANPAQAVRNSSAGSINYVADFVMDRLDQTLGAIDHDLVVETTVDPMMQKAAESALTQHLDKQGAKFKVSQGAMVALDPNGGIRALVGGRDYSKSQFNRAVAAKRQPGSAFKPFVYLTALERGLRPDTRRLDGPINIRGWRPENSNRNYYGNVTLTRALALSLNTVAVRLALELGPKSVADTARRLGVQSPLQKNASLALGTSEVNLLELTGAYAVFANGGIGVEPHVIVRVRRTNGRVIYRHNYQATGRIVAPQNVAMMNAMMQETLLTGTARKAELAGWQAAGKTGTTQDYRDAWFIGYTSHLVTGVWLGNDDSSSTKKTSGGNLPVDIWSQFMRAALAHVPPDRLPSGNWRDPARDNIAPPAADAGAGRIPDRFFARPGTEPGAPMNLTPTKRPRDNSGRGNDGNSLIPPGRIGAERTGSISGQDRNLLERMFGG